VGEAQVEWLRATLDGCADRCLVFGHHPFDEPVLDGHRYFARRADLASVQNRAAVREVLAAAAPTVAAVFAGHLHRTTTAAFNDIPYVTVGSLVDIAYTGGEPAGAYAVVTVGGAQLEVTVYGRAPAEFVWRR
jgi:predicted phosphodiesterase